MKKILGFLKNPWFLIAVGLIALAILIWFLGPLISVGSATPLASNTGRLLAIVVVGGSVVLYQLTSYISRLRSNRRMLGELVGTGKAAAPGGAKGQPQETPDESAAASAEEVALLRERLQKALTILKKARLGSPQGRRQYLYQLPWYIFIGPPGSGKTTALINSGLNFPLAKHLGKDKIKGIGGTRNCDWWFTDEAVLLDTAGRYTTQDSHQAVDQAAWRGFLDLLKKYRRRRPINGALIAVSLADLMQQSEAERADQAQAIKERIQELHEHLGIRFPVYVLFTKSDLIAGFIEFFNDLGKEQRAQVWGMTFPMDDTENPEGVIQLFSNEFELLEKRLNARLVERLQEEKDTQRRDLIYTFPQQFSSIKTVAGNFLTDIFRPTRFEERPLLRGVYFTSGTQEGTPVDRLMSSLAATFGLTRRVPAAFYGSGRSYFITRLLREVIFPEADLAGANLRLERWRAWIQRGAYAGAFILTGLVAAAWLTSYARNQTYVTEVSESQQEVKQLAEALDPAQHSLTATLPLLNAARRIPGGHEDRNESTPWLMGLGLYQGDKLGSEARATYQRLLNRAFLPRLILHVEERLRQPSLDSALLFEALKIYLMLDESQHFDPVAITRWLTRDWSRHAPQIDREQHIQLQAHLEALLEQGPIAAPIALDRNLIEQARIKIARIPLAQRIYQRLKEAYQPEDAPDFRLLEAAGPDTPRVFERKSGQPLSTGVSGLYTYTGYHQFFIEESQRLIEKLNEESWVLGRQVSLEPGQHPQLTRQVCQLYLKDYTQQWQELLLDIRIKEFSSPAEAAELLQILSGQDSPLRRLTEAVARETSLDSIPATEDEIPTTPQPSLCDTDNIFAAYTQEVEGKEGAIPPLDKTLATLNELYAHMNAIVRAEQSGAVSQDLKEKLDNVANRLEVEASRKPPPLNNLLGKLARDSADIIRDLRERLNQFWRAKGILPYFKEKLSGHYPLARSSIQWAGQNREPIRDSTLGSNTIQWAGQDTGTTLGMSFRGPPDVSLEAFEQFFGPNGLMDRFFKEHLSAYVDTSQRPWHWRGPAEPQQRISDEALLAFQQAASIKEALFQGETQNLLVRFQLIPLAMESSANQFILILGGQRITYIRGQSARLYPLQWPGPDGSGRTHMEFLPATSRSHSSRTEEGPWAWFKVLDQAPIRSTTQPGRFQITFQVGFNKIHYELRSDYPENPFRLRALESFNCPETL